MSTLESLANGETFIYIASRVFDFSEKIKAENIESAVSKGIMLAMKESGIIPQNNAKITFVPFRDTVQKKEVTKVPNQILTKKIYFEDIERLHKLFALVGFFDGMSKDEGVCMELGYAFGIGRPIFLAISDFVRANYKSVANSEHLVDPIIEVMTSRIIYEYKIPEITGSFREQLEAALSQLYARIEHEVYLLGIDGAKKDNTYQQNYANSLPRKYDVYIDFGGGLFEWQRLLQEQLVTRLTQVGLSCAVSDRYCYYDNHNAYMSTRDLGWQDINKARYSDVVITCSDSLEMNSGTAAIQGFSRAIGKKILLYDSKTTNMVADNDYLSSRNLMIDYSANMIISRFDDIPEATKNLLAS